MRSFGLLMSILGLRVACVLMVLAGLGRLNQAIAQQPPPLAAVARAEEARRKAVAATPGRRYTNADLVGNRDAADREPGASATPAEGAAAPSAGTETPPAATPEPSKDEKKDEKKDPAYWRQRMATAREQLERTQMFALALESRVNGLWADFTARDDPAQRSVVEQDRQKAIAELERVKRELADQTRAISAIEDEARRLGVPPGWLR